MTSLGSAVLAPAPAQVPLTTDLTPAKGSNFGSGVILVTSGGSVTPKRYVRLAGVAVPIQ